MSEAGVDPLWLAAAGLFAVGLAGGVLGVVVLRRRPPGALRAAAGGSALLAALLGVGAGGLCVAVASGLHGYRALTHEALAATVVTEPTGPLVFQAHFVFPDGAEERFDLAGDELAVEARILKWHPWANLLGLHTVYELDRVTGRYSSLADEQRRRRTVFALGADRRVDLFAWRQRLAWLAPLLDAEYGSASFTGVGRGARFEVRVSTTGLLLREVAPGAP